MKKERKIVDYKTDSKSSGKYEINEEGKIVNVEAIGKSGATGRRIGAVILWILGICAEVVAILNAVDKIELPKFSQTVWLIGLIVLDLIFVVIGSLLWKKANHIDPASKKNKVKFWMWNNLGSIISVIAFLPLIVFVLLDKDMDKKDKTVVSIVAAVALLIAGVSSYDFHPISSEELQAAKAEILANGNYDTNKDGEPVVYWVANSKKYHINSDCPSINRSNSTSDIYRGTIEAAYQKGLTEPCRICIKAIEKANNTENK